MASVFKSCLVAFSVACAAGLAVAADGEKTGGTQMCVQSSRIEQSPAIDSKTILLKIRGGGYKRIDLVNSCPGLTFGRGFSYSTSIDQLCTSDPLRVNEIAGATCMIKQIVDIDDAEAKRLMSKDHGKSGAKPESNG